MFQSFLLGFSTALTNDQIQVILQLTSVFENSTTDLQFGYAENIKDGRGITFGFVGFCTGTGDGLQVLSEYSRIQKGSDLEALKYLAVLEKIEAQGKEMNSSVKGLDGFINYINRIGNGDAFIQASLTIANKLYVMPSQKKASELGLKLPISLGQLYDSYLNHGEDGTLSIIKKSGSVDGNERVWLQRFLENRLELLKKDKTWKESVDRITVYQQLLKSNQMLFTPISFTCYGDHFKLEIRTEEL